MGQGQTRGDADRRPLMGAAFYAVRAKLPSSTTSLILQKSERSAPRQMQEAEKCYIFVTAALLTFLYHVHIIGGKR